MARRKKRSGSRSRKISVLAAAGMLGTGAMLYQGYKLAGTAGLVEFGSGIGTDGVWRKERVIATYTPAAIGLVGAMIAAKSKVNRYNSVPFFKL